jgi:hypothetical protein
MYNLPVIKYPTEWGFKRIPARQQELWVFDFEKNYDWDNLWYDCIQINPNAILLIGPPLYSTKDWIKNTCKFLDNNNQPLHFNFYEMDRVCITVLDTNIPVNNLRFVGQHGEVVIPVSQPSMEFNGKKTIVTISRDHPVEWLEQWIDYHLCVHGIDGFIIYNNQSANYTSQELQNALNRPDATIKIVDYDVPFGCMGGGTWEWNGKSGSSLPWDSDFSQYIMLEHAKWKYLHAALLAINADTDELLTIQSPNNVSLDHIAAYCQVNSNSVWLYKGVWIEPIDSVTQQEACDVPYSDRKFYNYYQTTHSNQRGIGIKWMLNPQKNLTHQWMLHRTSGPHMETNEISFGHYLAMNTSWSWPRDKFTGKLENLSSFWPIKNNIDIWLQKSKRYSR